VEAERKRQDKEEDRYGKGGKNTTDMLTPAHCTSRPIPCIEMEAPVLTELTSSD